MASVTSMTNINFCNVRLPLYNEEKFYRLSIRDGEWTLIEQQEAHAADLQGSIKLEAWTPEVHGGVDGVPTIDLEGRMMLPGLVDAHMHLDKSFSLTTVENQSGTLEEAVRNYSQAAPTFSKGEIKARIIRSALQALSFGTTHIRTHLDFNLKHSRDVAIRTVEAALEAKEALAPYISLQLFPMCPLNFRSLDTEAIHEALRMGVDGIGGAPHLSETPQADIDWIFNLAEKYDVPIDLHCDETDNPAMKTALYVAQRTIQTGYQGRVAVDHLCALASMTDAEASSVIDSMAEAKLKAVSLPAVNLYLQGRHDSFPVRRGVTRLKQIWEAGIPIAVASDNIHDPFHPFGRGDLLQIALIGSYAAHMGRPADLRTLLRMITEAPAKVLGLPQYGIQEGVPASFVILDGTTVEELFTLLPDRRWVYNQGRFVRTPGSKAEWRHEALTQYWQASAEQVSFTKKAAVKG
ncbi:amidohydrolase family protein [Paenibacillus ferrarius]|uniref:amidohydrolase family protein n=1 Tax=Paenibacillus ferrarius TaxID=1469647 RepID=UPI003D27BE08